jgi:hypothetical protein
MRPAGIDFGQAVGYCVGNQAPGPSSLVNHTSLRASHTTNSPDVVPYSTLTPTALASIGQGSPHCGCCQLTMMYFTRQIDMTQPAAYSARYSRDHVDW